MRAEKECERKEELRNQTGRKKLTRFNHFPICDFSLAALSIQKHFSGRLLNQGSGGLGQHSKETGFPCSIVYKSTCLTVPAYQCLAEKSLVPLNGFLSQ